MDTDFHPGPSSFFLCDWVEVYTEQTRRYQQQNAPEKRDDISTDAIPDRK